MTKSKGWIGVDLDGTLAEYNGWVDERHIGEPVPLMAARVKEWLLRGVDVRIFTARVHPGGRSGLNVADVTVLIQEWTMKHFGQHLPVTNIKDFHMYELWDDRAVQVVPNTGERVDSKQIDGTRCKRCDYVRTVWQVCPNGCDTSELIKQENLQ